MTLSAATVSNCNGRTGARRPYCGINENYSCPLTPFENRLKVAVRAGEKVFADATHG
jgi:uncharacterized protein (DUF1684 family)